MVAKKTKATDAVMFELAGHTFDSSRGKLMMADVEQLEQQGVNLFNFMKVISKGDIPFSHLRLVATVCLRMTAPVDFKVEDNFVSENFEMTKFTELSEFLASFLLLNLPKQKEK